MFLRLKRSAAMHLSGMRPAPELARGQLAAGIGAERTANAANNSTGRRHDEITELFARICGTVVYGERVSWHFSPGSLVGPLRCAISDAETVCCGGNTGIF